MKRGSKAVKISSEPSVIEQAGALCFRITADGTKEMLLVGSRRNGRWGLPKGHMDPGETSHAAAAREAFEEAGIRGTISEAIVGSFLYSKDSSPSRYRVIVHELSVTSVEDSYPETGLRAREWFSLEQAREIAGHDGLRTLLSSIV
ncbi:DNA mismatch repair protein MutT [Rhizobium wenxiniae]|uniref:8-oxo-dGTP pyrophosphatase MutT (NUDIX family) n=1 Tax=Rhizobium wenxiniae TaxID=1737357 RepID=A0A7X0D2I5_9HYPH|nr:NUDIX hydrolase [Rhizobium wenxiniae]MBB6165522.1 8-oxo-dGTP pyrophosphatase MutT (NUDIX family) [Rhizobium wenxiniae]GGG17880.1 DNA mismatch repair protein MutT [Rhizobium wenxiniae]